MLLNSDLARASRRLITILFIGQGLALIALFTTAAISSIAGVQLAGTERAAGWPSTATLIGGSLAAYPIGRFMGRFGRRRGLALGYLIGLSGGLLAAAAMLLHSFPLFLIAMALLGASRTSSDQSRYAAADVSPAHRRAWAVSLVVSAGTIGAVLGPALTPVAGRLSQALGADQLVGPWLATAALFAITFLFISIFLRPDPREIAREITAREHAAALPQPDRAAAPDSPARSFWQIIRSDPAMRVALVALALAQATMVMIMNITPVHMTHFAHSLDDISFVIALHILGMYALSIVTGWLSDRRGRRATIGLGAGLLINACVLAPTNPDTLSLAAALFLLGLGWNCCFVAGSSLLTDRLRVNERARIQGAADLVVSVASAIGSLSSGELIAGAGYQAVAPIGLGLAVIILAAALAPTRPPLETAAAGPTH